MESRGQDRDAIFAKEEDRYATFHFGRRVTRWRPRDEAVEDAIEAGHASRDEWGQLFFWVGAELRPNR